MKNALTRALFAIVLLLLVSCVRTAEKSDSDKISAMELEYLKKRDVYINKLKQIQDPGSEGWKDLDSMNRVGLDSLEIRLREILAGSRFGQEGKINLQSLIDEVGFGMSDGLVIERDSTLRLFYTSRTLFKSNFVQNAVDDPSPEVMEKIMNGTFVANARVTNFGFISFEYKEHRFYCMVAVDAQDIGPYTPEFLYVFVRHGQEILMAEKWLDKPLKEFADCNLLWDKVTPLIEKAMSDYKASNLQDTMALDRRWQLEEAAWNQYCECYREALTRDPEFELIKGQFKEMAGLLIDP